MTFPLSLLLGALVAWLLVEGVLAVFRVDPPEEWEPRAWRADRARLWAAYDARRKAGQS